METNARTELDESAVIAVIVVRRAPFQCPDEVADGAFIAEGIDVVRPPFQGIGLAVVGLLDGGLRLPRTGLRLASIAAVFLGSRTRVVSGKGVSVRVDLGGGWI